MKGIRKKRTIRPLLLLSGMILGIALASIGEYFKIPKEKSTMFVFISSIMIYVVFHGFSVIYQKRLNKRLFASKELLKDEDGLEKFIEYNEKILSTMKIQTLRLKVIVYLIYGYDKKGDYGTPIKLLEDIDPNRLSKNVKLIYYSTYALMNFKSGNMDEAMKIMEDNKKKFSKYDERYDKVGAVIFCDKVLELVNLGRLDEAIDKMEKARDVMGDDYYTDEYNLLLKHKLSN